MFSAPQGVTFPSVQNLVKGWVPPNYRSRCLTLIYSGSQMGTLLALLLAPAIINTLGWRAVFYLFGSLGLVWVVAWDRLVAEIPPLFRPQCNVPREASATSPHAAVGAGGAAGAAGAGSGIASGDGAGCSAVDEYGVLDSHEGSTALDLYHDRYHERAPSPGGAGKPLPSSSAAADSSDDSNGASSSGGGMFGGSAWGSTFALGRKSKPSGATPRADAAAASSNASASAPSAASALGVSSRATASATTSASAGSISASGSGASATSIAVGAASHSGSSAGPAPGLAGALRQLADIPWGAFARSRAVWAIVAAHGAFGVGHYITLSWLPTYFSQQYGLDVRSSAYLALLPWVVRPFRLCDTKCDWNVVVDNAAS